MKLIKESLYSDGYIMQEEGMLLSRMGNTNYFKDNPYDAWAPSKLRDSIVELDPNDIEYSETPSETKLEKMGDYIEPDYRQYDTGYPVAMEYNDRLILLDGHHRVELAKRAGKKILVAVKNIDSKYGSNKIVKESLNEIAIGKSSGIEALRIGKSAVFPGYNLIQKIMPNILDSFEDFESIKMPKSKHNKIIELFKKINQSPKNAIWCDGDWFISLFGAVVDSNFGDIWNKNDDIIIIKYNEDIAYNLYYNEKLKMGMYLHGDVDIQSYFIINK